MRRHRIGTALALGAVLAATGVAADDTECGLAEALGTGTLTLKQRYRLEHVDQDAFNAESLASTLRSALAWESGGFHGFQGLVEFEDVTPIGNDAYNSTINGRTGRPVVADPNSTEVNQLALSYTGVEHWTFRVGRQRITLDNHRWVGNVGWRQNEQTFDAATAQGTVQGVDVFYGYLANVNRVFGDESPVGDLRMHSHLLNIAKDVAKVGRAVAYVYHLDFDTVDTLSSTTMGLRLDGKTALSDTGIDVLYTGEVARQTDAGDNPLDLNENYVHLMLGAQRSHAAVKVGYEVLGGSGTESVQTPLATLHAHNGWADMFLATPAAGLEDWYVTAGYDLRDLSLLAVYHDYSSDQGSTDYGTEWGFLATYPICPAAKVGFKYANYDADNFATDTEKVWLWLEWTVKLAVSRPAES